MRSTQVRGHKEGGETRHQASVWGRMKCTLLLPQLKVTLFIREAGEPCKNQGLTWMYPNLPRENRQRLLRAREGTAPKTLHHRQYFYNCVLARLL
jgi:hypothetical protein